MYFNFDDGGNVMQHNDKNLTRNLMLTLSYDGSGYHGWQVQNNAITVQEVFQKALEKVLKESVDIKGCSRTDSFVHANMYTVSFKTSNPIKTDNIIYAVNRFLPDDISVNAAREVPDDFNARYSCAAKEYIYKIWNHRIRNPFMYKYALHYWYNLDVELLNETAKQFIGTHDFTSFATLDARNPKNMTRTIHNFEVYRTDKLVEMKVSANGFLYNMVRIMVGTLLRVAQGKIKKDDISKIIEMKNRKYAGPTAPPQGLYLNRVIYDETTF